MTSSSAHDNDPDTQSATFRRVLLGVLVVALVASGGVLVWLLADRQGEADELQAEREQVMAQTEQFMLRMGTFGPDLLEGEQMPEYRERVTEVITPKFRTSFEESVATAEQLVAQAGVSREAEVFSTGVVTLDSDSATTLVAGTFTDTYRTRQGQEQEQQPVPFRIELDLVRTDGEWLVDDFTPVTGGSQ